MRTIALFYLAVLSIWAAVCLLGCGTGPSKAPPIVEGKCVVDVFKGPVATQQVCVFKGYNYKCTDVDCTRTGEATGELPK